MMVYPTWYDGKSVNEVEFCRAFLQNRPLKCIRGKLYSIDGEISDSDISHEISVMLTEFVTTGISRKVKSLLEVLKLHCHSEPLPIREDEIHLLNGVLKTDGTWLPEKRFCTNRLNIEYHPEIRNGAYYPERFLTFLYDLLEPEDIDTLQEYLGYCLIPSTKGQAMLFLIGNGGEGKSRIGVVLQEIFKGAMLTGSFQRIETDKFFRYNLQNKLLMLDDDMQMTALPTTGIIKNLVTAEIPVDVEAKGQQSEQAAMYARFLCFGNGSPKALYDKSDGFARRLLILTTKQKPPNRIDDPYLAEKFIAEKEKIFCWMFDGLRRLIRNNFRFTISERTRKNVAEVMADNCNIIEFLKDTEFVTFDSDCQVSCTDLYGGYILWCSRNALTALKRVLNISMMNAVTLMERHNERLNHNYSNKDIDINRSSENYHLKKIQAETYRQEFDHIRIRQELKGNLRLHGEKQSTVLCEFVITSDKEFFDIIGKERTRRFFEDAYDFVTAKAGGEQYVLSAVVHMDEATPHMHVAFIPVINGKDRKGNPCKRINCSEFWKGRDSYSRLQDEYYDFITSRGYDLERGEKGSTAEHLSVAEYKLKKTEEQLAAMSEQILEIENIEEIKTTNLPLNTVAIKKDDFEMLSAAAKNYVGAKNAEAENVQLKAECLSLKSENETLKSERDNLSGQLYQLEYEYGRFYETVADDVDLAEENENLKAENDRVGCQVHTLLDEVMTLKQERYELEKKIEDKDKELIQTKSLFKALQEKFDKVMDFIKRQNLKEKLEEFLKPVVKHKSR